MMVSWRSFDRLLNSRRNVQGGPLDALFPVLHRSAANGVSSHLEETPDAFVFRVDLPGVSREEVTISFAEGVLTVRAERQSNVPEGYTLTRRERPRSAFERRFRFRTAIEPNQASARFDDGVLTVTLPKADEAKAHTITVV